MESNLDHTLISVCFPIISAYCQVEFTHNYNLTLNEDINQKKLAVLKRGSLFRCAVNAEIMDLIELSIQNAGEPMLTY